MRQYFIVQSHCGVGEPEPTNIVRAALQWFDRGWADSWRGGKGKRIGPTEGALVCSNGNVVPLDFLKPEERELAKVTAGVIALALGPTKELPSWSCEGDDPKGHRVVVRGETLQEAIDRFAAELSHRS